MLAQTPQLQKRKLMLRWFVALSSLPLLGIVAAFGIVPQQEIISPARQVVVETITLPLDEAPPTTQGLKSLFWRTEYVQRGDTIDSLLQRMNVNDAAASQYLHSAPAAALIRRLPVGKAVQIETHTDGSLVVLRYTDSSGNQTVIERDATGFTARNLPAQLEQRLLVRSGEIDSSLFAAMDAAGLPDSIANQLAELLGGSIDLYRDLRKGDQFNVVYEMNYSNGEPTRAGRIQAAEFINQGVSHRIVYFEGNGQRGGYFTPEGRSMHRTFLRSPLEYSRVSSKFSLSRFHPVLAKWRTHKGVDYAAPTGTKIRATADGIVAFAGKQGGYGNMIKIQHASGYTTLYGHLSRFAPNLHRGSRVSQGDIIGHVGMTGLASGPHLHYEFMVHGQPRDPMRVVLPDASPIPPDQKSDFLTATRGLTEQLAIFPQFVKLDQ